MKPILFLTIIVLTSCNKFRHEQEREAPQPPKFEDTPMFNSISEARGVAEGFFTWYAEAIKSGEEEVYKPAFTENELGNMTLDFENYKTSLQEQGLSDELIEQELATYSTCVKNLNSISSEEFEGYTDLDQFEAIECDFGNTYRWTGGQGPVDGFKTRNIKLTNGNDAEITGVFYLISDTDTTFDNVEKTISLSKVSDEWKITGM